MDLLGRLPSWRRLILGAALLAAAAALLSLVRVDDAQLQEVTAVRSARRALDGLAGRAPWHTGAGPISVHLDVATPRWRTVLEQVVESDHGLTAVADGGSPLTLSVFSVGATVSVEGTLRPPDGVEGVPVGLRSGDRTGAWTSLLPPVLAILLAVVYRRLILALFLAVWLGAGLHYGSGPVGALRHTLVDYVWAQLTDSFNAFIFAFTFSLVGMVGVVTRMGGIHGLVESIARRARTAASARLATALLGIVIFFDDYANTVVVGTTMRPLTDRMRISREKLAYLVDSTAAPIAGLAVVSTWIGFEVEQFERVAEFLGLQQNGYAMFFEVLPYRFYCLFTLVFVVATAVLQRDYGPMLAAERRAARTGQVCREGARLLTSGALQKLRPVQDAPLRWLNAVIPVAVVVLGTFGGMLLVGASSSVFEGRTLSLLSLSDWKDAFIGVGEYDNAGPQVLAAAAVAGSLVAIGLALGQRILSVRQAIGAWLGGARVMVLANAVLLMAWSIRAVCADVGTPLYLTAALQDVVAPALLPLLVFGLAAVVGLWPGPSGGTMGILLPTVGPMAWASGDPLVLVLCLGAVLDGAIFGDHCSPLSDTTVLSSISSSCDHVDHVRTQLPYAVTTMLVAGGCGYVLIGLGGPIWAAYGLGLVALLAVLLLLGRKPDVPAEVA